MKTRTATTIAVRQLLLKSMIEQRIFVEMLQQALWIVETDCDVVYPTACQSDSGDANLIDRCVCQRIYLRCT